MSCKYYSSSIIYSYLKVSITHAFIEKLGFNRQYIIIVIMTTTSASPRSINIDFIKIIAMLGVLFLHTTAGFVYRQDLVGALFGGY